MCLMCCVSKCKRSFLMMMNCLFIPILNAKLRVCLYLFDIISHTARIQAYTSCIREGSNCEYHRVLFSCALNKLYLICYLIWSHLRSKRWNLDDKTWILFNINIKFFEMDCAYNYIICVCWFCDICVWQKCKSSIWLTK